MAKKRGKAKSAKPASVVESPTPVVKTPSSVVDSIDTVAIAAALSSVAQPVLMKVCRLCETKDGPFLNIFDPSTLTAKKTQELMPFVIAEYDDLPHKICFRCSAKVEELHDFVQKCIRTQDSLRKALGKSGPKTQISKLWEEKLHKSNISNDDICDALIKKAMAGIEDLPLKPLPLDELKPERNKNQQQKAIQKDSNDEKGDELGSLLNQVGEDIVKSVNTRSNKRVTHDSPALGNKTLPIEVQSTSDDDEPLLVNSNNNNKIENKPQGQTKSNFDKTNGNYTLDALTNKRVTRDSRALKNKTSVMEVQSTSDDDEPLLQVNSNKNNKVEINTQNKPQVQTKIVEFKSKTISSEEDDSDNSIKIKAPEQINQEAVKAKSPTKETNFDIMDHVSMIKVNGVGVLFQCKLCNRNFLKKEVVISHACAKTGIPKIDFTKHLAAVPDPPKVTTVKYINTRIDGDSKKSAPIAAVPPPPVGVSTLPSPAEVKSKPKIGPASKVQRSIVGMVVTPIESSPIEPTPASVTATPAVEFPSAPNLKSRYKLVPGPNNTFTLVEDADRDIPVPRLVQKQATPIEIRPKLTPVKTSEVPQQIVKTAMSRHIQSQVINVDDSEEITPHVSGATPYPVGLFSTVPHTSNIVPTAVNPQPVPFTTPAMKKQSYTIVKTGNPSKLLISTKAQVPVEEPPKKKPRKTKAIPKSEVAATPPFNATPEDSVRSKDSFFTFINVDPLLQPSYVLPTDNIIQESQISTSTPQRNARNAEENLYNCNMCSEKFSREKKLLAHIQSHYSKMDEEDQVREKNVKRRGRSSNTNNPGTR